ncbi:hypothetical protein KI387_027594, partial [Taxus chinensis]
ALGEKIEESIIVTKILRSLTAKYDAKVSTVEETKDIKTLTMDELHNILSVYEMRTIGSKSTKKEVAFKAKTKTQSKQEKEESNSEDEEDDVKNEEMFVRRLRRGS